MGKARCRSRSFFQHINRYSHTWPNSSHSVIWLYRDISLKQATRTSKQGKRLRMHFILGYIDKVAILRKWQCPSYSLLKKLNNQFVVTLQRRLNFFCENDKFDILYQRIVRRSFLMAKKYLITMKKHRR